MRILAAFIFTLALSTASALAATIPYTLNVPVTLTNFAPGTKTVGVICTGYTGANESGTAINATAPPVKRVTLVNGAYSGTVSFTFATMHPMLSYKCMLEIDGVLQFNASDGWSGTISTSANLPTSQ